MRIAMMGSRGIPALYGGSETAIEEIGERLVRQGHQVTAYCRRHNNRTPARYLKGIERVVLPSINTKNLDTPSHTFLLGAPRNGVPEGGRLSLPRRGQWALLVARGARTEALRRYYRRARLGTTQVGLAGAPRVRALFTLERHVAQLLKVYREVMGDQRNRRTVSDVTTPC